MAFWFDADRICRRAVIGGALAAALLPGLNEAFAAQSSTSSLTVKNAQGYVQGSQLAAPLTRQNNFQLNLMIPPVVPTSQNFAFQQPGNVLQLAPQAPTTSSSSSSQIQSYRSSGSSVTNTGLLLPSLSIGLTQNAVPIQTISPGRTSRGLDQGQKASSSCAVASSGMDQTTGFWSNIAAYGQSLSLPAISRVAMTGSATPDFPSNQQSSDGWNNPVPEADSTGLTVQIAQGYNLSTVFNDITNDSAHYPTGSTTNFCISRKPFATEFAPIPFTVWGWGAPVSHRSFRFLGGSRLQITVDKVNENIAVNFNIQNSVMNPSLFIL